LNLSALFRTSPWGQRRKANDKLRNVVEKISQVLWCVLFCVVVVVHDKNQREEKWQLSYYYDSSQIALPEVVWG
jgi:hypothetical protein